MFSGKESLGEGRHLAEGDGEAGYPSARGRGRADPASGGTHAQAPIPLSHTAAGAGPRRSPFLWAPRTGPRPGADPRLRTPNPTLNPRQTWSHLRQLSNEKPPTGGWHTDTAAIFPRDYFRGGGGSKPKRAEYFRRRGRPGPQGRGTLRAGSD